MPFKLKLKKSRHYSVVSKSLFVISVEILDNTNVECTLSSDSTGQDCLDIVCQKLGLNQPKFFGLQYMSRNSDNNLYWLELDRPIKRQLDKYANGLNVYLRVMYYVISGVRLINDEVTRNHYFLQLKSDVIDERIPCTPQQAVELASYAMQAEFGNFDSERHTSLYLKDFQLFPKSLTDPGLLETLTEAAIRQHASLHNLPQGTAEEYYICACQQLEGYGQEIYAVKDRLGDDANISVSLTEVSVGYAGKKERRHYGWTDIKNVINHKRDFTIETVDSSKVEFQFHDVESAKNAWRFCVLQHTFYRQYEMNNEQNDRSLPPPLPPSFQQNIEFQDKLRQIDSYEGISDHNHWDQSNQSLKQRAQSTSCLDLNSKSSTPNNVDHLRSLLPSYRPAPDYETAVQIKYRNSSTGAIQREPPRTNSAIRNLMYSSQPEIHQTTQHLRFPDVVTQNSVENSAVKNLFYTPQNMLHLYKPPPPYPSNRITSNSTPDLAAMQQFKPRMNYLSNSVVSGSSPDLVSGNLYLKHYSQMIYPQNHHPVHRSHSFIPPPQNTYENLSIFNNNLMRPQAALIVENPNVTKHIKKVYDEHGNIIYCMPANMNQILKENQLPSTGFVVNALVPRDIDNSNEPIYENIPLPWQNNDATDNEMRARTQSIHSAPEVVNHTVVNAIQNQLKKTNLEDDNGTLYANLTRHSSNKSSQKTYNSSTALDEHNNTNLSSLSVMHKPVMNSTATSASSAMTFESSSKETTTTENSSVTSNSSGSGKQKKKRWGMLIGRSKSTEKVKSATLGREREKKDKNVGNNKHRWSTGLPRFNPLPPSISKETMCQLLENKVGDSQLFFEFDNIPKKKPNADFKTASQPDNSSLNRFKDVLPYEDNRLRLTPSRNNKMGYINASHITATVGSKQRFYIAAQGPDRATLPYFWQCVWEAEVYLIVQLTDRTEDLDYMPDSKERCVDEYQVWWEFSQNSGNCITSKVRLCHVTSRRYRTLWHMHYTDWGDQGCPQSVGHFLGFLEEMQSVQQHSMDEIPPGHNKNPPVLVHCTAGVGRTGLTILADLLLYTVDHNQEVCIPRVVELLRYQRAYMIQTIAQYRFVYLLLIHYLKQTRLI